MITKILRRVAVAVTILLLGSGAVFAQHTLSQEPALHSLSKMTDRSFAKQAAWGSMAQVKFGQLAENKGDTEIVKDFGMKMVSDYGKALSKLKSAASQDKMTLPNRLSLRGQQIYDRLSKLSGASFDRTYAHEMVGYQERAMAEFRQEAQYGKKAAVKRFAAKMIPILREDSTLAYRLERQVANDRHSG
ncbi:MAG: DUF4142 domain-containing protein [Terriglobia bacterium]